MRQAVGSSGYCSHAVRYGNWRGQDMPHHSLDTPTVRLV